MVSWNTSLEKVDWICKGNFDWTSSCIQRTVIDTINLIFLALFCLFWLLNFATRHQQASGRRNKDVIAVILSACCGLTSIAYLSTGLWDLVLSDAGDADKLNTHLNWVAYILRGAIWTSLAVSLLVSSSSSSKLVRITVLVWWVTFTLLVSALNIKILLVGEEFQLIELLTWPVNFLLLLYCGFRNLSHLEAMGDAQDMSEPLLVDDKDEKNESKIGEANFFGKIIFSWINPLLTLGFLKPLKLEDIPSLVSEDEANISYQRFKHAWEFLTRDKGSRNLVVSAMFKVFFKENILVTLLALVKTLATAVLPLLLYAFVNYSNLEEHNLYQGLSIVGCLILVKLVESLSQRHWFFLARRCGMKMRSAMMLAVYEKQLKLSSLGRKRHSAGEIVNYISVDAYRMGEFPWWLHSTWSLTLQLFLSIAVLFGVVGVGAVTGLVPLLMCGFLNIPFAKALQKCQSQFMVAQDERLRATSEILNSMKIIKLQSWEDKFKNLIESRRETEFKWLSAIQLMKPIASGLYWLSPTIISTVTFIGCAVFRSAPLNASTIFTVLATLRGMGEPVRMIPECMSIMIQVQVSFNRVNAFLLDHELKNENLIRNESDTETPKGSVRIEHGKFSWDPELTLPTLSRVNLRVQSGQKVAVCGPVGGGKSSLLYAILGEIPKVFGTVDVSGSIAYVSQTSWIQSGTVRENVLYGKPMNKARYEKAIKACALDKDINSFPHGDLTEIGQRGLNMSGGQKQRIQLARAVYNDADIYLLDDPFSAVDAHTAVILFNDCVMSALEKKTVILVTHQVEFLSSVDRILVMEDGQITQSGSYGELLMAGTAFEKLVNAHKDSITTLGSSTKQSEPGEEAPRQTDGVEEEFGETEMKKKAVSGSQLTEEEEKEIGDAGLKPYFDYLSVSKGTLLLCLGVILQTTFFTLQVASTYWLAYAIDIPGIGNGLLIGIYALISTFSAIFVYLRSLATAYLGLRASKSFFSALINAIFKAPMSFFDSTPVGRILTRVSSDMSILDFDIPFSILFVLGPLIELLAIIGIMASVTWQVLIVAIFALIASKYVQDYYVATARELIRINGTTKAPVMNYASETSLGVVTIRAFKMVDSFFRNYMKLVDQDAMLFFHTNGVLEWLVIRIEALQNLTLFTAALLLVLLPKGTIAPGLVGLSLSYALSLTGTHVFMIRWHCNLGNYIVSVERMKQFMHIQPEPAAIVEDKRPPSSWPENGRIELQELKVRYRANAPLVLKGISCRFKEGSRIGVVGRTGSGKTTLISALFRLVEPDSGRILIDGLDICSMGLKDLRMKLSVIPQEPTLFRGSVRTNLDPLGLYTDDQIWEALDKCQLKPTISTLPNLLDSSVSDEGENWSAGQRQLFCLGRVLLRRNKILVLDEATASIDSSTDSILQKIIRQEFAECTVITVAHRVPTVIDSDMVMVLSYGELLEYDEPSRLMKTSDSSFSKLVAEYWSSCSKNNF
ncbi:ABC transporter C family member 8 [Linum grandiflorum]